MKDEKESPVLPSIRVVVPEEYGTAYDEGGGRQWVERRQRMGRALVRQFESVEKDFLKKEKAFQKVAELMGQVFTDWNLTGDDGPLPKPWGNSEAFVALVDSDLDLFLWVSSLIYKSISQLLATEAAGKN